MLPRPGQGHLPLPGEMSGYHAAPLRWSNLLAVYSGLSLLASVFVSTRLWVTARRAKKGQVALQLRAAGPRHDCFWGRQLPL